MRSEQVRHRHLHRIEVQTIKGTDETKQEEQEGSCTDGMSGTSGVGARPLPIQVSAVEDCLPGCASIPR